MVVKTTISEHSPSKSFSSVACVCGERKEETETRRKEDENKDEQENTFQKKTEGSQRSAISTETKTEREKKKKKKREQREKREHKITRRKEAHTDVHFDGSLHRLGRAVWDTPKGSSVQSSRSISCSTQVHIACKWHYSYTSSKKK
jgi:hypothetical protein